VKESVEKACDSYRSYHERILLPATSSFLESLGGRSLRLHEAVGANLLGSHALDHLREVRLANGSSDTRDSLIGEFDEMFAVEGARSRTPSSGSSMPSATL
jgi:hypothetical protein